VQKKPARGTPDPHPSYPIASVDKALRLILMVRRRRTVRVTEAGAALGVAYSTAHRLLAMLEQYGFVRQEGPHRAYIVGPAFARGGLVPHETSGLCAIVRPALGEIVAQVDETTHFVVLEGTKVVFLEGVESSKFLRGGFHVGHAMPAHATSGGKVLLASLTRDRLRELYPRATLPSLTPATIVARARLEAQLLEVRRRGYAISYQEIETGVNSVAVPVQNKDGETIGAFVAAGPAARLPASTCRSYAEVLRSSARGVAKAIA
jgi:IclR family acetate operon transcriptional repressor